MCAFICIYPFKRLLHARELMKQTSLKTVLEISRNSGYRDPGYFSRLYQLAFDEELVEEPKKAKKPLPI